MFCLVLLFTFWTGVFSSKERESGFLRRLIGSNCVLIQRGIIPPYYDCIGCEIEEAAACIDDMRFNRTRNVAGDCRMASVKEFNDRACCPKFYLNDFGRLDLSYVGSAYPEALRCMVKAGCESSVLYAQLQAECETTCPIPDERDGRNICFSNFNSATTLQLYPIIPISAIFGVVIFTWLN